MNILVTGGCGYIGSHVTRQLSEAGHKVRVIDDLSTGFADALLHGEGLIRGDVGDPKVLESAFNMGPVDAVLHFAASIVVPESVADPLKYYRNNTVATIRLLEACVAHKVPQFIFSSTAAVYGDRHVNDVSEQSATAPENPYAWSKLMDEQVLRDVAQAHGLRFAVLRYFNVAGADPQLRIGQRFPNATHLIKVACEAAVGRRQGVAIFGTDYPTVDGTGVRDYIHVEDLASAHLAALQYLHAGGASELFNCGYGRGYSVRQVLSMVEKVSGKKLHITEGSRRPGDVGSLIADANKIRGVTGWAPKYDQLETIVASAFGWEQRILS